MCLMEIVSPIISSAISFALGKAYNWIAERKNKKADIEEIRKFVEDSRTKETFQKIEFENGWYEIEFHGTKFENDVDDFLMSLTLYSVSYKEKDSNPFMVLLGHMLVQTLKNFDMQTYLYNLRNFTLRTNTPNPYAPLIEWGKNADVLGKDFFDETNKSGRYVKTMNW